MSPLRTFRNCGSSSKLVLRKNFPTRVTLLIVRELVYPSPFPFDASRSACAGDQFRHIFFVNTRIIVDVHRPEFQECEALAVLSNPLLSEKAPGLWMTL